MMYHLPEQRPTVSPGLQRENLIYISFFQLYSSMMRIMRKNYDVRNEDCYKPIPPDVLRIIDQQYESLKSIMSYDLNARPVEDRVYAWQIYDVDPIYSTTLYLINELGYTELTLLALEHPLVYQTNEEWHPCAGELSLEEYIDPEAGCYLVPLKALQCDPSVIQTWYRKLGQPLIDLALTEYVSYKRAQQSHYPEEHLINALMKEETKRRIVSNLIEPPCQATRHHPLYDELLITYDFTTDERLERVLDLALNHESWMTERCMAYPWLLSLYCACIDLFKLTNCVVDLHNYCLFYSDVLQKVHNLIKTYIKRDIACTAKELVTSLTHPQSTTSNS